MRIAARPQYFRTVFVSFLCIVVLLFVKGIRPLAAHDAILYAEDFEDSVAQDWDLQGTWTVVQGPGGNWVLSGSDHYFATYNGGEWGDYTFTIGVKLIQGTVHINWRSGSCGRYYLGFQEGSLYLAKEKPWGNHQGLTSTAAQHQLNLWYSVKVVSEGGQLDIYVDDQLRLSYADADPCLVGTIALETLAGSEAYVDDIVVLGDEEPFSGEWVRSGGPPGGLGYDIRYRFDDPTTWYVTDAYGGAHRSVDDGETWIPINEGIIERFGATGDAIPVFCLTIDPHNPQVIWIGTQSSLGIYKSTDSGATWTRKVNGITDPPIGVSVRGITVHPNDSDTVYAQAELSSGNWAGQQLTGKGFDLTMGVVYRTTNGGDSWSEVWRGDNLARYVWINPVNPDVMYISTGIFDREAANSDPVLDEPGGVGVMKSVDGGTTWTALNESNGLNNLCVGSLFMHPTNPDILLAGTGNYSYNDHCGVYLSTDAGATWAHVLATSGAVGSVEFALANPLIAYAGTPQEIFRSEDGGLTWARVAGGPPMNNWGPPGMWAGIPIDFQVDPSDPNRIFVNNYGGGNVLSADGGITWQDASTGYTGSMMRRLDVYPGDPSSVYVIGRSGPFRTSDSGTAWSGLSYAPAIAAEWGGIAVDPTDPEKILISDEHFGMMFRSTDGGHTWILVYDAVDAHVSDDDRGAVWAIEFSPSNPSTVYAGLLYWWKTDGAVGVIKSTDGGATWTQTNDAPLAGKKVRELAIDPGDEDTAYAATELAQVFKTTDGGTTWISASSGLPALGVGSLAMDPTNPQILYAGVLGGGVYKTTDGGLNWAQSSAGMDPQAMVMSVVVDPTDSAIVYAGDAHGGAYRSVNGGIQWFEINVGLEMRHVNCLAISSYGERLYAATEGGGVFRLDLKDEISCSLTPATDTNPVGTSHTVTSTVMQGGDPLVGATVSFAVTAGPNAGQNGSDTTDSNGQAAFTYTSNGTPGTDSIQASGTSGEGVFSCSATKTWQISEAAVFRVTATGDARSDGTFYGAAFETGAADIAEWVRVATPAEPGDVLELDPTQSARYRTTSTPCSHLVAGVVSTEPGIILGADEVLESRVLLALSGIVPVKVTNEGGPITPGDLLVTASTPGHAMRWSGDDVCLCALVGKALEPMTDQHGVILVLLTAH